MNLPKFSTALLLALSFVLSASSEAKVIQILHTNDLHAALNTAGAPEDGDIAFGGWAQIKTVMDQLTQQAKQKDIETIRLDAGDFFEGTLSYFPDHGRNVLKAFQSMGYDAAALGNHDWLMGAQNMNDTLGKTPFPFPVLSANSTFSPYLKNLRKQIVPSTQIVKDGIKIGIVGVSTDEIFYKWITKVDSYKYDMVIDDYRDYFDDETGEMLPGIANAEAAKLRKKNDLVIALTHIGFKEDKDLAESSSNIDLVVGGHSHTILESLAIVDNQKGDAIPVVQTGATGVYIGKILVDVVPGQKPKVLTYELVPVPHNTAPDLLIADLIQKSEERISDLYGADKLNKVVGRAETRLVSGTYGKSAYSQFVVDAMRDTAETDIAVDIGEFHTNSAQEKGEVTKRKLMEMYPRKLNVEQNEGLYVYRFRIPGWALKIALYLAVKFGYELSTSGIEYTTEDISDEQFEAEKSALGDSWKAAMLTPTRVTSITIGGQPIRLFRKYTVATPEFLVRGAYAISWLTRLVIRGGHPTHYSIWDASEKYLSKIGVIREPKAKAAPWSQRGEYPFGSQLLQEIINEMHSAPEAKDLNNSEEKE